MALAIFSFDGVNLDPPATSHKEACERTKDNPIAIEYRRIESARINKAFMKNFKDKSLFCKACHKVA